MIQRAKVGRYFCNQSDYMAKELFDKLTWSNIDNVGTNAVNFIDDDTCEIKLKYNTNDFNKAYTYIYKISDGVINSYWFAQDVKLKGRDFIILSLKKEWWLTYFVQNTQIYNDLLNTEISFIRSPFFESWMLNFEDPLLTGIISGSNRTTRLNGQQYWALNEELPDNTPSSDKIHYWFRKGEWGQPKWNSQLNNYAVFVFPAGMMDNTKFNFPQPDGSSGARAKFEDLVFFAPIPNAFNHTWNSNYSNSDKIWFNYDPLGSGTSRTLETANHLIPKMTDGDGSDGVEYKKYFVGYYIGAPANNFVFSTPMIAALGQINNKNWWDAYQYPAHRPIAGFVIPYKSVVPIVSGIPDITGGAIIGGQQLGSGFYPRYFNDPQPNIYTLNYLDTKMNGASVKYGSLIAGSRYASGRKMFMSDGYQNKNNYISSGIQTMQLLLSWNGRFILNKRTNYTSLPNNCETHTHFIDWPTIYFPMQLPVANDGYNNWLAANKNQLQAAQLQADVSTTLGLFMALMTGILAVGAAPFSGGSSLLLAGAGIGAASTFTSGLVKNQQIAAQYKDAKASSHVQISNVLDDGLNHVVKQWQYFSTNGGAGNFMCLEMTGKETWEIDSYSPNATNFTKLNNIIFYNGFYGQVSRPINNKPSSIHCAFFQANDVGLFNKISDAVFKTSTTANGVFIKPDAINKLVDALTNGMRLWQSNPSTINIDLKTGKEGSKEIEMHQIEPVNQSMPDSAVISLLTCLHKCIESQLNEQANQRIE